MAAMTAPEAHEFLAAGTRTGKLATASPTGAPHVAPVWFIPAGADLVFTTFRTTVKGRNLRANPRAALTVDSSAFPDGFVVGHGPVTVEEHPADLRDWATRIAERYVPAGRAGDYGRRNAVDGEMLCRLRIERIVGVRDIAL
jgi:PPOX class probable F420-dependent enzyme